MGNTVASDSWKTQEQTSNGAQIKKESYCIFSSSRGALGLTISIALLPRQDPPSLPLGGAGHDEIGLPSLESWRKHWGINDGLSLIPRMNPPRRRLIKRMDPPIAGKY